MLNEYTDDEKAELSADLNTINGGNFAEVAKEAVKLADDGDPTSAMLASIAARAAQRAVREVGTVAGGGAISEAQGVAAVLLLTDALQASANFVREQASA